MIRMKISLLSSLALLSLAAGAMAAPGIDVQLTKLEKRVDNDLASGALTKSDGDELKREIGHVKSIKDTEPRLTRATRRDLRQDVAKDPPRPRPQRDPVKSPLRQPHARRLIPGRRRSYLPYPPISPISAGRPLPRHLCDGRSQVIPRDRL